MISQTKHLGKISQIIHENGTPIYIPKTSNLSLYTATKLYIHEHINSYYIDSYPKRPFKYLNTQLSKNQCILPTKNKMKINLTKHKQIRIQERSLIHARNVIGCWREINTKKRFLGLTQTNMTKALHTLACINVQARIAHAIIQSHTWTSHH